MLWAIRVMFFVLVFLFVLAISTSGQERRGSDAQVRTIIQQALDDALHDQVKHLYASWMKDDAGQPKRASVGIRKAVASYRHAIKAIETEQLTGAKPRLVAREKSPRPDRR